MNTAFFFQTQQIPDTSSIFDQLKQQNIFFSYFQVDQNYYLFVYAQQSIDINFLYQSVEVIEELDSKQRKIRSLRGFFLYALEIMEKGEDYEILSTNLQPFFWRKVKNIIRQNKKSALQEFLFGSNQFINQDNGSVGGVKILEDQMQTLQNQFNSFQDRIRVLENTLFHGTSFEENSKYTLSATREASNEAKSSQQDNYTLKTNFQENDEIYPTIKSVSEVSRSPLKTLSHSEESNLSSNQNKAPNRSNFITFGKISEDEKIEIIKLGFQRQAEGKISLKKYYESTDPNSLFQLKGYNIKYDSIRRIKLYQQFKPSNN